MIKRCQLDLPGFENLEGLLAGMPASRRFHAFRGQCITSVKEISSG